MWCVLVVSLWLCTETLKIYLIYASQKRKEKSLAMSVPVVLIWLMFDWTTWKLFSQSLKSTTNCYQCWHWKSVLVFDHFIGLRKCHMSTLPDCQWFKVVFILNSDCMSVYTLVSFIFCHFHQSVLSSLVMTKAYDVMYECKSQGTNPFHS